MNKKDINNYYYKKEKLIVYREHRKVIFL